MSDALDGCSRGLHRRVGSALTAVSVAALVAVCGPATGAALAASAPTPTVSVSAPAASGSARARVLVTTTRSTVHAAGSTVPAWGLVFLVAVFVVAVALALPATRRRSARSST